MAKPVATSRRSQLVSTYGVGALYPAQDASFMILGLDEWPEARCPAIVEPRLARAMNVWGFKAPPSGSKSENDLPVIRFPMLQHCASCHRLDYLSNFCAWDKSVCEGCQRTLTPSRFVTACERGHIDEFPYFRWLHHSHTVDEAVKHQLKLKTRGESSSLADIVISCSCGVPPRSLGGSFGPKALAGISTCHGARPWLRDSPPEECDAQPRALQRGASTVWFPSVRSAIAIPPWSEGVHQFVEKRWKSIEPMVSGGHLSDEVLVDVLAGMATNYGESYSGQALLVAVRERLGVSDSDDDAVVDLRTDEFRALHDGHPETSPGQQFVAKVKTDLSAGARLFLDRVCEVSRLREVRALEGFTRVGSGGLDADVPPPNLAALTRDRPTWLPAIEVLGEGVFLNFDHARVDAWADTEFAESRRVAIQAALDAKAEVSGQPSRPVTAKEILLHTTAHVLITELSLDAGYPAASLRERLYVGEGQAGMLLYTATADSAGSLGGLSAQAAGAHLWRVLGAAVNRSAWCSTDPVCIEAAGTGKDSLNLAACHACVLLPETSCERANTFLDRAMLVGHPDDPDAGFFNSLLEY